LKFDIEYKVEEVTCYRVTCSKQSETPLGFMCGGGGLQPLFDHRDEADRVAEALNADIARKIGKHL